MTLRRVRVFFLLSVVAAGVLFVRFLSTRVQSWAPLKAPESTVR